MESVFRKPGILLTTYGMVQHNAETFCREPRLYSKDSEDDGKPLWDLIILDEVSSDYDFFQVHPGAFFVSIWHASQHVACQRHLKWFHKSIMFAFCGSKVPALKSTRLSLISCIVLQGHKIKNTKTVIAQQLRKIPVKMAVVISGTPIQNNLMEMHSLFDFVQPVSSFQVRVMVSPTR